MKISLNASTFGEEEIQAAIEVLRSSYVTMGKHCLEFEAAFAKYIGSKNAIFVNSGSSANLLAFFALAQPDCSMQNRPPMAPGSEVLVPAVTWSTTVWPIVQAGFIPVLVDADPKTLQMDPDSLELSLNKNTSAICPVHVLGNAVDMSVVSAAADAQNLWVIEDTCESLGTKFKGKFCGSIGDIGTFSFFFSHHITTIEGGMIVTDNDFLADILRSMRSHGWTRQMKQREDIEKSHADLDPRFLFVRSGFNLRPTEINAVFGIIQLKKLAAFNQRRNEICLQWQQDFKELEEAGHLTTMAPLTQTDCTWFGFPVLCRNNEIRNKLQSYLEAKEIETRPIICGNLARQPAFKNIEHRIYGSLKGADKVMDCGLFWGAHPMMTEAEVSKVSTEVTSFFKD